MNSLDNQLKELYVKILSKKRMKTDRTCLGTNNIFGYMMRFDMSDGFPITTLINDIDMKSITHEMLWCLGSYDEKYKKFGNTNIKYLIDNNVLLWSESIYDKYKKEKFRIYQDNDLKNSKEVKQFKFLSYKDFIKKLKNDDDFAIKYGDLGPIHSKQWNDWGGSHELVEKTKSYRETKSDTLLVDKLGWESVYLKGINQIQNILELLVNEPDSKNMVISSYNISDLEDVLYPTEHLMLQFFSEVLEMDERIDYCEKNINIEDISTYMSKNSIDDWSDIRRNPIKQIKILEHFNIPERKLSLHFSMKSVDATILPSNISSYSLLLHMISQIVDMLPHEVICSVGDVFLQSNNFKYVEELLDIKTKELPIIKLNSSIEDIYDFRFEDILLKEKINEK